MKSEHRHELKTNELADWIAGFPQWAKENLRTIIYVSAVVAVIIVVVLVKWYTKNVESVQKQADFTMYATQISRNKTQILQAQSQGVDVSYMLIQLADKLQPAAEDTKNDQMAALALIKKAELLRMELHYRPGVVSQEDTLAQINRAKAGYTEAIQKSSKNPSLKAMATLGLGLCEEELGNFEAAKQIYNDIASNPDFGATVAAAAARERLDTMTDYEQAVVFKSSPKPEPAETATLAPQVQLTPSDTNLPDANLLSP